MITLNGTPINITMFPDKTSQVWKLQDIPQSAKIVWDFENEAEFIHLAQLKQLLDASGSECFLEIKYLPYARQDKDVTNESTFALNTFAKLLNSLNFLSVTLNDPHSPVALQQIRKSWASYNQEIVWDIMGKESIDLLCYPDKGAVEKYIKIDGRNYVYCDKVRNQLTGEITGLELVGSVDDKNVLIRDDLCDGGYTFVLTAKKLLTSGAKSVSLFVSHGLFTKGLQPLIDAGITSIYTKEGKVL